MHPEASAMCFDALLKKACKYRDFAGDWLSYEELLRAAARYAKAKAASSAVIIRQATRRAEIGSFARPVFSLLLVFGMRSLSMTPINIDIVSLPSRIVER